MNAQAQITTKKATRRRPGPDPKILRGCRVFRATPEGEVVGFRQARWDNNLKAFVGRKVMFGPQYNPRSVGEIPALHQCPLVPDDLFDDVMMSDTSYFNLCVEQYVRHMTWLYHELINQRVLYAGPPAHKAGDNFVPKSEKVKQWVEDAAKAYIASIEKQYGMKLNQITAADAEMDQILLDASESIRDTFRRYGRSNAVRRGLGRG